MAWSYAACALIAAGAVGAFPAPASAAYRAFRSPSGKIGCAFYSDTAVKPQVRCDWQNGGDRALILGEKGKARKIHVTDTVRDPDARALAYGKSTSFGRITCTSRMTGITCRNASHHGFTVSVQKQRVF